MTYPRFGASAEEIDDLSIDVSTYDTDDLTHINSVTIIGVANLETTYNCVNCRKNISCDPETKICRCDSCGTKQKLRNCKLSARLFVQDSSGQQQNLKAHGETLANIINTPIVTKITEEDLLECAQFDVTYDRYSTIVSISRQ